MSERDLRQARAKIAAIFTALRIKRVVWIDDQFAISAGLLEGLLDLLMDIGKADEISDAIPGLVFDPEGDWRLVLPEMWTRFDASAKRAIWEFLLNVEPNATRDFGDTVSNNPIRHFCPKRSITVEAYPPSMWDSVKPDITRYLEEDSGVVLCLFDRNFAEDRHPRFSDGVQMLKDALDSFSADRVICGLLSQTFKINEELTEDKRLAKEVGVPESRFIPLAKDRLKSGLAFADGIRLSSLMLATAQMAYLLSSAATTAAASAEVVLRDLSINDFSQIVLKTSDEEGIWEVETLLRLFNLYQSRYLRKALYKDRAGLTTWTNLVRGFTLQSGPEMDETLRTASWKHSKLEYYESDLEINEFHFPLELGDVFQIGERLYILLGQPCDLAIRSDGKRSAKFVTLVEIAGAIREEQAATSAELKFFGPQGETSYVLFKQAYPISLDILDLTTLSSDGTCAISLADDPEIPIELPVSFRNRFKKLRRHYLTVSADLDPLYKSLESVQDLSMRQEIQRRCLPAVPIPDLISDLDLAGKRFTFGVQRVARFRQPRVSTLLQQWAAYIDRPASDRDYE